MHARLPRPPFSQTNEEIWQPEEVESSVMAGRLVGQPVSSAMFSLLPLADKWQLLSYPY